MKWIFYVVLLLAVACFAMAWKAKSQKQVADDEVGVAMFYLAGAFFLVVDTFLFIIATIVQVWAN